MIVEEGSCCCGRISGFSLSMILVVIVVRGRGLLGVYIYSLFIM